VEKSFFLRAVIVFIFFLILLILTSEPVLLNKLPLPHSPARTHLLLSIGANCHRHTHKNTHTHTHTHTVFINYDIHVQWSIWRHGKSWVQLLADNSWVLRTWLWIHLISSNCFSCSHHSLTHSLMHSSRPQIQFGIGNGIGQTTTYHECRASMLLSSLSSRFLSNYLVGVWSTNLPQPPPTLFIFFQPMGVSQFRHQTQFFLGQFCDVGKVLMIHRYI